MYKEVLNCVVTNGIHNFREENECHWLFSDVIAVAMTKFLNKEDFLNCSFAVKDNKGLLKIDDGNGNLLYKQSYSYTDLKQNISFYACFNEIGSFTLMLKEEY